MKTRLILAAAILAVGGLAGCAPQPGPAEFDAMLEPFRARADAMRTWIGKDADELIKQWGPPLRDFRMENGNRILEYGHDAKPGPVVAKRSAGSPPADLAYKDQGGISCGITITASPKNIIIKWTDKGNSCVTKPSQSSRGPLADTLNTWIGARELELTYKWGQPRLDISLNDGGRVLDYSHDGGPNQPEAKRADPDSRVEISCLITFIISSEGIVTFWQYKGDDCE